MGSRVGHTDDRANETVVHRKSVFREYAETILICVMILIFPRTFVFQQSEIPSGSMEDTILIGDYILVNRFLYAPTSFGWESALLPTRAIRRGDVVVFKQPQTPETDFIKRVIGLPGDRIAIRRGEVYVNGERLDEPYVGGLYRGPEPPHRPFEPLLVEDGHYFMMGDHRNASQDSRAWGQVNKDLIKGRAFMVLFSTNAPPPSNEVPGQVTPTSLVRKLFNLVFRARWDRAFTAIR
ncbi:signal peptidase I [bacterium]|nr:signal peptidase I [bacterium]